jgi:drug/metabolite transporter (DMT)-like permease
VRERDTEVAALLALASAASYGAADIAGAVATRRAGALWATLGLQTAGVPLVVLGLLLVPGTPSLRAVGIGAAAGAVGILGLVLYLRSLAIGPVGVISPVAALVGTSLPVLWGVLVSGDALGWTRAAGIVLGLVAVTAVAWNPGPATGAPEPLDTVAHGARDPFAGASVGAELPDRTRRHETTTSHHARLVRRGPLYGALAGVGFGLYMVLLDATPDDSGLWPLLGSRPVGMLLVVALLLVRRPSRPSSAVLPVVLLAGLTDTGGTVLFLLATREGALSLVSLLTSLAPVVAVVLARVLLHERLRPGQLAGVATAVVAIMLLVA